MNSYLLNRLEVHCERLEKALDKLIYLLCDITDCQNLSGDKFYRCPFKEECDKQKPFKECIATEKKWKEWALKEEDGDWK